MDWVVNRYTYSGFGDAIVVTPGAVGQVALPLTISDQVRILDVRDGGEVGWGAIPEGWGPRTYAVRGHISYAASLPEVPSNMMARITVHGMDQQTLGALVSGTYTLTGGPPDGAISADEPFAWQDIVHAPTPSGIYQLQTVKVNATCNRRLENNEALYLVLEVFGAGDMDVYVNLRTLCAVEDR